MSAKRYLLDADVLVQAHRFYYAFDICPAFWREISARVGKTLFSVDKVLDEICQGHPNDPLRQWAEAPAQASFFLPSRDPKTLIAYGKTIKWSQTRRPQYAQSALDEFAGDFADARLVAYAHAHDFTLVTKEKNATQAIRKVKIPDACAGLSVPCIDTYEMLRALKIQFR